ncbi:hypothetical protein O1611_g9544 [Lasiodiplodia mahajangana]|uniref:Uncharacterized protein n=1 Tax=Lasiodiplodia mahajangana TaxID=1108764 RepID=A0ACC2J8G3_9PEZI|nr:hypothetical protein O1611_g9544 [Lasiodiplodia mahajangana]
MPLPNTRKGDETLLGHVAANGNKETAKVLIEGGADIEENDGESRFPLYRAVEAGKVEMCLCLLELKADPNHDMAPSIGWGSLLHFAVGNGREAIVIHLLKHGADIETRDGEQNTPLLLAASTGNLAIFQHLVNAGADINVQNEWGGTPLAMASWSGYWAICQLLVDAGADIDAHNMERPPLCFAAANGHLTVCRLLVDAGADLNALTVFGENAVSVAAELGHVEVVRYLLTEGASGRPPPFVQSGKWKDFRFQEHIGDKVRFTTVPKVGVQERGTTKKDELLAIEEANAKGIARAKGLPITQEECEERAERALEDLLQRLEEDINNVGAVQVCVTVLNFFGLPTINNTAAVEVCKMNVWDDLGGTIALAIAEGSNAIGIFATVATGGLPFFLVPMAVNGPAVVQATARLFLKLACDLILIFTRAFKDTTFKCIGLPEKRDVEVAARAYRHHYQEVHKAVKKAIPNLVQTFQVGKVTVKINKLLDDYKHKVTQDIGSPPADKFRKGFPRLSSSSTLNLSRASTAFEEDSGDLEDFKVIEDASGVAEKLSCTPT